MYLDWQFKHIAFFQRSFKSHQDGWRKRPKTMNTDTFLWNKSYKTTVLPKIEIEHWFYMLRSAFLYAQRTFLKCEKQQLLYEILGRL